MCCRRDGQRWLRVDCLRSRCHRQCFENRCAGGDLGEQTEGGDGGVVGGGVGGAAGVGDDDGAVAQVGGLAGGAFDREVGGDAGEQEGVDAAATQQLVQLAGGEPPHPLVGDDQVAVLRVELVEDL